MWGVNYETEEVTKREKGQNRNRKSLEKEQEMCILSPIGNVSTVVGLYLMDKWYLYFYFCQQIPWKTKTNSKLIHSVLSRSHIVYSSASYCIVLLYKNYTLSSFIMTYNNVRDNISTDIGSNLFIFKFYSHCPLFGCPLSGKVILTLSDILKKVNKTVPLRKLVHTPAHVYAHTNL